MSKQFVPPEDEDIGANLEFPAGKVTVCTACEMGLVYVAKIVVAENKAEFKKLRLCNSCRNIMIETLNKVFGEGTKK